MKPPFFWQYKYWSPSFDCFFFAGKLAAMFLFWPLPISQRVLLGLGFHGRAELKNLTDLLRVVAALAALTAIQSVCLTVADGMAATCPVGGADWFTITLLVAGVMVAFALVWVPLRLAADFIFSSRTQPVAGVIALGQAPSVSWVSAMVRVAIKPPRDFS